MDALLVADTAIAYLQGTQTAYKQLMFRTNHDLCFAQA